MCTLSAPAHLPSEKRMLRLGRPILLLVVDHEDLQVLDIHLTATPKHRPDITEHPVRTQLLSSGLGSPELADLQASGVAGVDDPAV